MLRSIGHARQGRQRLSGHANWSATVKVWKQDPIRHFIEPTRDALLKEFEGGLSPRRRLRPPAIVVDVTAPSGTSLLASFEPTKACDVRGRPVLPLFHAALMFWDRCLTEAEAEFPR